MIKSIRQKNMKVFSR